jgi:hypothetical protein
MKTRAKRFHALAVFVIEAIDHRAVHIPHAEQAAVGFDQRHHDFRLRSGVAGDVPGELVHVAHQLRFARLRGGAADAAAERDADARRLALERTDHQFLAVEQIEAGPVHLGQAVRRFSALKVRRVGDHVDGSPASRPPGMRHAC